MDAPSSPPPSLHPLGSTPSVPADQPDAADHENTTTTTVDANPNPSNPAVPNPLPGDASPEKPIGRNKKKAKKRVLRDPSAASSSSSASISSGSSVRGTRVAGKRRTPKVVSTASRRNPNADEIAFRLGMSIAAFVAQILERNDELGGWMSSDHLAKVFFPSWTAYVNNKLYLTPLICASAVRESLANDFGNTFDCFIRNFEESFGSTLRTLKSIKESSTENRGYISCHQNMDRSNLRVPHDEHDDCLKRESSSVIEDCHSEEIPHTNAPLGHLNYKDEVQHSMLTNSLNLELSLHGQTNQLACVFPRTSESGTNQSILKTIGKSVMEQARANDLKTLELNLTMQRLKMKETQLDLHYDSNQLERSKFAMGISKQSFKAEKFKSQLEDTRHAELLRRCNDCLVFGLLVMAGFLMYGVYVYSYERLTEGTASCTSPSTKGSKSWLRWEAWDPMTSFNSWFNVLWCKVQVVSRALIGLLTIVAITFVFLHCSATAKRIMPVTYIVLLLGLVCGTAGKFCIDTLGGKGNIWVMWWEIFCMLHFLCNVFTSTLYLILYGSVDVSQRAKRKTRLPYGIRQVVFFAILFLLLPVFCGLLPFASLGEWKHHFVVWVTDLGYW